MHSVARLHVITSSVLSGGHLAAALRAQSRWDELPMIAWTVYWPLLQFQSLGLPALGGIDCDGWTVPTTAGLILTGLCWLTVWWWLPMISFQLLRHGRRGMALARVKR